MDHWKERAKDYAEEVKDAGESAMEKTRIPRWLWPLAAFVAIVAVVVVVFH